MAEEQPIPPDPIRTKSLSGPIAISTLLLIVSTAWAIWDEAVHKRPYLDMQDKWITKFGAYLDSIEGGVQEREVQINNSPEYQALSARVQAVKKVNAAELKTVIDRLNEVDPHLAALDFAFRDSKGRMDEFINRIENASGSTKESLRKDLAEFRAKEITVEVPAGPGKTEAKKYTPDTLVTEFLQLKAEQGKLQGQRGVLAGPEQAAIKALDDYKAKQLRGVSSGAITAMKGELERFDKTIKQIHIADMGDLVDRCESCHLGARSPIKVRAEDVGGERAFISHPDPALLDIHDPDRFGCSPCHGGNGVAVINEKTAHGKNKHWLWPMWSPENRESGCNQCHGKDLKIDHAKTLEHGKETYRWRGCWGCHRYEGYDTESDQLTLVRKDVFELDRNEERIKARVADVKALLTAINALDGDAILNAANRALSADIARIATNIAPENREAIVRACATGRLDDDQKAAIIEACQAQFPRLTQEASSLATARATKTAREHELLLEVKKVGPSLKEVKMKIKPEWLPGWIKDPASFRPDTKMPSYARMTEGQAQAIAAFIWSRAVTGPLAKNEAGDAKRGEGLIRDRGCLGCHAATIGGELVGNNFAANLSRVGEKDNFDYLVRWVTNPKQKTLPYSYGLKRDLKPEDFQKVGLPFEFDHVDPRWPAEWGTLLTHQMTVMPNLRLSNQDARDIAAYLVAQKQDGASYPEASEVVNADAKQIEYGEKLVKNYGCSGCHEIAGLEDVGRIGTELTKEGSKPIERLDFGLLTHEAEHEGWYNVKGFVDRKLKNPQVWDQGKEITSEFFGLKMPNFRLADSDITAVSTFLQGSLETNIPAKYQYLPVDQRQAIQEGWWVVRKYNCAGCHAFEPGDMPVLWKTTWFTEAGKDVPSFIDGNGEDHRGGADRRPPSLVGEGARVDPQWLGEFLRNPALSRTNYFRNGVRPYLNVRMPTFELSDGEVGKLVRFFNALASQPTPYVRPEQVPLTAAEAAVGNAIFQINGCVKCHATGEQAKFTKDIVAPSFHLGPARLRPDWVRRWVLDPASFLPGTSMPGGLFKFEGGRWVVVAKDAVPDVIKNYPGDHAEMMVRFVTQFTTPGVFTPPPAK